MVQVTELDLLLASAIRLLRIQNELLNAHRKPGDSGVCAAGNLGFFNPNDVYVQTRALLQQIDREIFDDTTDPRLILQMNEYADRLSARYAA